MKKSLIITIFLLVLVCGFFIPSATVDIDFSRAFIEPSLTHIFGTDWAGRDIFILSIKSLSSSLVLAIMVSLISTSLGFLIAVLSMYDKPMINLSIRYLTDVFLSLPSILLMIVLSIVFGKGYIGVGISLSLVHWIEMSKVLRSEVVFINGKEFIEVSKSLGKSSIWIISHQYLPLLLPQMVLGFILNISHIILHEASLTFLGFGLGDEQLSMGTILTEGARQVGTGRYWTYIYPLGVLVGSIVFLYILKEELEKDRSPLRRSL